MPSISINSQPILFPTPLEESCFKTSSGRLRSSCRDVSQQGLQSPPMRELVTGDPMACSILGRPSGFIARRQSWHLLPRLKHGRVESIDQLARYHAQFNTPMEWHRQFCSSETRFDQYAVYPEQLAFRRSASQRSSHARWSTCLFLFTSFSTSYAGIPSATCLTTV